MPTNMLTIVPVTLPPPSLPDSAQSNASPDGHFSIKMAHAEMCDVKGRHSMGLKIIRIASELCGAQARNSK